MAEQVVAEYKLDVNQAVKGLDKLQAEYAKTEAASRKAAQTSNDSFIKGSDGAKRFDAELKKQPKTLAEMELKLRNLRELLRDDTKIGTEGFKKIRAEIDKTEKEVQKLNGDLKKTGTEMSGLGSMAKKVGGFLAAAFAVDRIISFTKEVVTLAAQSEGVERAFSRIGSPQILQGLREATRGTVSDLQLMQNSVKASNFKIPLESLASLFKFAQARARETGESVDYLVDSIILGIGRKSPLILDNLGISAVELRTRLKGVGVEAANVGDIAAIIGDIATEELAKMGDQADTTADKIAQFTTKFENLKVVLGKIIAEDSAGVLTFFGNLAQAISDDISELDRFKQSLSGQSGLKLLNILTEERAKLVQMEADATEKAGKVRDAEFNKIQEAVDFQREVVNSIMAELDARIDNNNEIEITNELIDEEIRKYKERQAEGEKYVRSLNQLNKELKEIDKQLKDVEIGSQQWFDLIEKMFNKTEELNDANEELAYRLAVLDGAFDKYEDIETKGIDDFTKSVEKASAALKKAKEESQIKSLQLTGDENIDPSKGFPGITSEDLIESNAFDEALKEWNQYFNSVSQLADAFNQISQMQAQAQINELNRQLDEGLISREEYDKQRREILNEQAEQQKGLAIFEATINGLTAVVNAYSTDPTGILAGITAAIVAAQIAAIAATPVPQYAKGVIALQGAGTETSDSIHAKLSKGESVMTAAETKQYKDELWAIRRGNFEDLIMTKYVKPMIDESLFKGFADMGRSAQLNGITANLKDHNILHGLDRLRQSQQQGFQFLAAEQRKLFSNKSRGGYRA
jgi:hypothetical protein